MKKLKIGSLIEIIPSPLSWKGYYNLWDSKARHTYQIPHGSNGLVVDLRWVPVAEDNVVDIWFWDIGKVLTILEYNNSLGEPLWCNILQ